MFRRGPACSVSVACPPTVNAWRDRPRSLGRRPKSGTAVSKSCAMASAPTRTSTDTQRAIVEEAWRDRQPARADRAVEQRRARPVGADGGRGEQAPARQRAAASACPSGGIAARRIRATLRFLHPSSSSDAEREHRRLPARERVVDAKLVVAVAQRAVGGEEGEQRARVRIPGRDGDRAAAAVPRRGHDAARVVDGHVRRCVHAIRRWGRRARRHDSRDETAEVGGIARRDRNRRRRSGRDESRTARARCGTAPAPGRRRDRSRCCPGWRRARCRRTPAR